MRKSYCILIALLTTLAMAAQPRLRNPEFWVGVHGGATAGTVIFSPAEPYMKPITKACVLGGTGGFVFRYAGHKYCHFQMELNYMHRGWAAGNSTVGRTLHNLHYIELPIMMHVNVGSDICRWFFNLGPQIGYCFKDEEHTITQPFDWGLMAGTGFYVRTTKAGVYELEVRFDYSFGGVYGTDLTDHYDIANPMDLCVRLGWFWPIKKKD